MAIMNSLKKIFQAVKNRPLLSGWVLLMSTWGSFFVYSWSGQMFWKDGAIVRVGSMYGYDWPVHFSYVQIFAQRHPSDWFSIHPLFSGGPFNYTFVADMISGLMVRFGVDILTSIVWPSLVVTIVFITILYLFFHSLLRSVWQSITAVSLFFLNGGLGFLLYLSRVSVDPSWNSILTSDHAYTSSRIFGMYWTNIVFSELINQRALLLGMPIALLILWQLMRWFTEKRSVPVGSLRLLGLGVASGLLMIIHVHSLMALALFSLVFGLLRLSRWREWFWYALGAGVVAMTLATVFHMIDASHTFMQFHPGWIAHKAPFDKLVYFWLMNWFPFFPIAAWATWKTKWRSHPVVLGAWLIFLLGNLFSFQPWAWDNMKLFTWSYLVLMLPVVTYYFSFLRQRNIFVTTVASFIFFLLIFSGMLDVVRSVQVHGVEEELWSADVVTLAEQFKAVSDPMDIVLTSTNKYGWVASMAGRPLVMEDLFTMQAYGIDADTVYEDITSIYEGSESARKLLELYNVSFIVMGPLEKQEFDVNESFFEEGFEEVLRNEVITVYAVDQKLDDTEKE